MTLDRREKIAVAVTTAIVLVSMFLLLRRQAPIDAAVAPQVRGARPAATSPVEAAPNSEPWWPEAKPFEPSDAPPSRPTLPVLDFEFRLDDVELAAPDEPGERAAFVAGRTVPIAIRAHVDSRERDALTNAASGPLDPRETPKTAISLILLVRRIDPPGSIEETSSFAIITSENPGEPIQQTDSTFVETGRIHTIGPGMWTLPERPGTYRLRVEALDAFVGPWGRGPSETLFEADVDLVSQTEIDDTRE